jgi:methylenetetrahydrofolate dehydrogenase (NADP+) / methenyltetrahydrofolate cyclohydrolase
MTANLLDGKKVAADIKRQIKYSVDTRVEQGQEIPGLAVILIGNDAASKVYVNNKRKACQEVGYASYSYDLPVHTTEKDLIALIERLNHDPSIDGILVQLPLPPQINTAKVIETIKPDKDVDGFHPYNLGRLAQRNPILRPCTPFGIIRLLEYYNINLKGIDATIIGASNIVGRPMSLELLLAGSSVTICHRFTPNLQPHVENAQLVIIAAGKMDIVKTAWLKKDHVIVDVGIHRLENGRLRGDINHANALEKVAWISPVPGGVGPMTIALLLENTLFAAEKLHNK